MPGTLPGSMHNLPPHRRRLAARWFGAAGVSDMAERTFRPLAASDNPRTGSGNNPARRRTPADPTPGQLKTLASLRRSAAAPARSAAGKALGLSWSVRNCPMAYASGP
jgi:hypothetical protein